ncbi:hypothetical protein BC937DRAFT_90431 [Endogone sp. FLAS-F59071]|nr:hypothetical protein BC937DRAFT_90431 [Endogone sp. FLAS-F59071]|eukprot:RUS22100.1 hypothetical protein BC937DRAFT_90431 [Endogone sp. FLAS-F59071]
MNPKLEKEKAKQDLEAKKAAEQKKKEELAELFKPIQSAQKIPFGTDPKTVLCQYFKAGNCEKGTKCKFSHDLNVERKTAKKDLYTDSRDDEQEDTMDTWDQKKLEEVVLNKHGNPRTTTDIVCKYFLDAIENQKYGWFWECPNGGTECKYRHALPPGFVLKSSKKKEDDKEEISIEDFLEVERHKLGTKLTPVNLETFTEWKKSRQAKYEADELAKRKALESRWKSGKSTGMSGKNLFEFNPDWANEEAEDFEDGDDVFDLSNYKQEENGETEEEFKQRMENMSIQDSVENGDEGFEEMDNGEGSSVAVYQEELFAEENLDDLDEDDEDDDDED